MDAELLKQVAIQIVVFLLFYVVIKKLFYEKIDGIITKRKEMVAASLNDAKAADEKAELLEVQYKERVEQIENERVEIMKKAAVDADAVKERIMADARVQANSMIESANKEIAAQKSRAQEEFKDAIVDMTMDAAQKVVKKALNKQDHLELIDESISMFKEV